MYLDEALVQIENAIETLLQQENTQGGQLEEATEIKLDYKVKNKPKPPALYIFTGEAEITHEHTALKEYWIIPVHIISFTKNRDIKQGREQATRLAARARSIILKNRNLGLDFVMDVNSVSFAKQALEYEADNALFFASEAVINIKFWINEN